MAKSVLKAKINADAAIRDPIFWIQLVANRITFGLVSGSRWKRYVEIEGE